MRVEMTFVVEKVLDSGNPAEQFVEAVQSEAPWQNPNYKGCTLRLGVIDDGELKKYGPGKQIEISFEL